MKDSEAETPAEEAAKSKSATRPAGAKAETEPIRWVDDQAVELPARTKHLTFFSKSMNQQVGYVIYLPSGYEQGDKRYPVLYWLHGKGGTELRYPALAKKVDKAIADKKIPPMILAMPNAGSWAFYQDAPNGKIMAETLVVREFIPFIDKTYRTIAGRDGRMLQGYSMGGHGSLKLALKYPELFSSVAAGAPAMLDAEAMATGHEGILLEMFGNDPKLYIPNRPVEILKARADEIRGKLPMMIFAGSVDRLLKYSEEFRDAATAKNIPVEFIICDGLAHNRSGCYDMAFDRIMEFQLKYLGKEAGGQGLKPPATAAEGYRLVLPAGQPAK